MSETRKLYYEDVYKKEFTAKVLECRKGEKGFEIILDQSAFYPEGGGQPCDLGTLNEITVLDVQEKDGEIVHYTKEAITVGSEVIGKIDWERRFDLMQQHSGEHIVSGLVHEAYGYDNVGFHMSSDVITVDLSGVLTEAQLAEIEAETNKKIWENSEVEITYPSKEELEKHGIFADFVPSRYSSRELAAEWIPTLRSDEKVLLARAEEASEELSDALKEAGIDYEDVALYHTAVDQRKSEELNRILPQVDYVTLCSASAVRAYVSMLDEAGRQSDPRIICIGPVTERAARAAGLAVHQSAVVYTAEGIKDVLLYDKRVVK